MINNAKKESVLLLIFLLMIIGPTINSYSNSAEPPSILIIVPDAPDDLEISIRVKNKSVKARKTDKMIETYFTFYYMEFSRVDNYNLWVQSEGREFQISIEAPLKMYNNVYTLDINNQSITKGKSLGRSITLVSIRIAFTLLIEGIIFYLLAFRTKKSWSIFLVVNLMTQGLLNIWINGFSPMTSYIIFSLFFWEIIILIIELMVFLKLLRENNRLVQISYVILANFLSLWAGGYLITVLPI
ncbi:hypothetical protein [Alkaliphilus hydrothermalis]|uniref:Uncharacterized protein n=1 Tax=Alkaliphilus hydrothermalis TaxID=1482730 RepID=A0ABS2NS31_9FIRM|nr:hypothetical protein [Alkaliphilus hydrothermalis]MBM7615757.1 hypothetical protein [Alkaliphilus hydrothermalis]